MPFPLFDDHFKEEEKSSSANIWHHLKMLYNILYMLYNIFAIFGTI